MTTEEKKQRYREAAQMYRLGLAEGRKEKCFEQNKDGTIRPCEVMKDNEQLKEKLEHRNCIDCSNHGKQIEVLKLKAQIEKMKCCGNCKHNYEDNEFCCNPLCTHKEKWELAE